MVSETTFKTDFFQSANKLQLRNPVRHQPKRDGVSVVGLEVGRRKLQTCPRNQTSRSGQN
jgi:hypothetical protein